VIIKELILEWSPETISINGAKLKSHMTRGINEKK